MSTTQPASPTITNAGTVPRTPRKLFVNVAVSEVQRSIRFFEQLGFAFNAQFTDASATCMLAGTDAYFMLMVRDRFATLSFTRFRGRLTRSKFGAEVLNEIAEDGGLSRAA